MTSIKDIIDNLSPEDKQLLKDNRNCFDNSDWSTLTIDYNYILVMIAIAKACK